MAVQSFCAKRLSDNGSIICWVSSPLQRQQTGGQPDRKCPAVLKMVSVQALSAAATVHFPRRTRAKHAQGHLAMMMRTILQDCKIYAASAACRMAMTEYASA